MSIRGVFASHSALPGERQTDLSARVLMTGFAGMAPLLALTALYGPLPLLLTALGFVLARPFVLSRLAGA